MKHFHIIGFGHMGQAFYQGLKQQPDLMFKAANRTSEKVTSQGLRLLEREDYQETDILLLAIKPQNLEDFIAPDLSSKAIIISILAGTTLEQLKTKFPDNTIIRCMPNLGIQNGNGVLGWHGENLTDDQQNDLKSVFAPLGLSLFLPSEDLLDNLSLISGSGPGYFAYLVDVWQKEAQKLGFDEDQSRSMVLQTIEGSLTMLKEESAQSLADRVSSKGGITEAIIHSLKDQHLDATLSQSLTKGLDKINQFKS